MEPSGPSLVKPAFPRLAIRIILIHYCTHALVQSPVSPLTPAHTNHWGPIKDRKGREGKGREGRREGTARREEGKGTADKNWRERKGRESRGEGEGRKNRRADNNKTHTKQ